MDIVIVLFVALAASIYIWKLHRNTQRELETFHAYWDLDKKIDELLEDPFMSSQKWGEWLPILKYAEDRYRVFNSTCSHSLVGRVERIIR